jgi:molybdopterin-binding protein
MPVESVATKWGNWTPPMLQALKFAYAAARRNNADSFELEGQPMLTSFARHLIDYLEAQGLVAADESLNVNVNLGNIAKGQEIVSKFFEGITGIVAYSVDHIAIYKGEEVIAIIGSPDLAEALRKGTGN